MDNNNNNISNPANNIISEDTARKLDSSQSSPAPPPPTPPGLVPELETTTTGVVPAAAVSIPQSNDVTISDQVEPARSHFLPLGPPDSNNSNSNPLNNNNNNCNSHSNRSRSRNYPSMNTAPTATTIMSPGSSAAASLRQSMSRDYFYFDANTFKQVKRLYEGMLMVAMAYSVTMIIMMIVLYKTLPQTLQAAAAESALSSSTASHRTPLATNHQLKNSLLAYRNFDTMDAGNDADHALEAFAGEKNYHLRNRSRHESALTYLDQMIAINFLSLILYSLAFYAAHRELYTLTLAFTSTLAFTMMFSVVKIFVEGVHFPNNFMSLLLRVSIVFVALVYLGQLRRKQQYVQNANTFWLTPNSFLNHPVLRSSQMSPNQTAQLIREFLASTSANGGANSNKTDEDLIREYQDQPPNYEEALRCPVPNTQRTLVQTLASSSSSSGSSLMAPALDQYGKPTILTQSKSSIHPVSSSSQLAIGHPPPSFEQLSASSSSPQFSTLAVESLSSGSTASPASQESGASLSTFRSESQPTANSSSTPGPSGTVVLNLS